MSAFTMPFHPKGKLNKVNWKLCARGYTFRFNPIPQNALHVPGSPPDCQTPVIPGPTTGPVVRFDANDSDIISNVNRDTVGVGGSGGDWFGTIDGTFYRIGFGILPQGSKNRYWNYGDTDLISYCGEAWSAAPIVAAASRSLTTACLRKQTDGRIWIYATEVAGLKCANWNQIRIWKRPFTKDLSGDLYPASDNGWRIVQDWIDIESVIGPFTYDVIVGDPNPLNCNFLNRARLTPPYFNESGTQLTFVVDPYRQTPWRTWKITGTVGESSFSMGGSQAGGFTQSYSSNQTYSGDCGWDCDSGEFWCNFPVFPVGNYDWTSNSNNTIDDTGSNYYASDFDGDTEVTASIEYFRDNESSGSLVGSFNKTSNSPPAWTATATGTSTTSGFRYGRLTGPHGSMTLNEETVNNSSTCTFSQGLSGGNQSSLLTGSATSDTEFIQPMIVPILDLRAGIAGVMSRKIKTDHTWTWDVDQPDLSQFGSGPYSQTIDYKVDLYAGGSLKYTSGWENSITTNIILSGQAAGCGTVIPCAGGAFPGNMPPDSMDSGGTSEFFAQFPYSKAGTNVNFDEITDDQWDIQYILDGQNSNIIIVSQSVGWWANERGAPISGTADLVALTWNNGEFNSASELWEHCKLKAKFWPPSATYPTEESFWCKYAFYDANQDEMYPLLSGVV